MKLSVLINLPVTSLLAGVEAFVLELDRDLISQSRSGKPRALGPIVGG